MYSYVSLSSDQSGGEIQAHLDEWSAAGWKLVAATLDPSPYPRHNFYWQQGT